MNSSPRTFYSTAVLTLASSALPLTGAVIVDPTLSSIIDPVGDAEISGAAPGAMSQTALEAMPDFYVVQNFAGFANGTAANYISFTDTSLPDIQFVAGGGASDGNSGGANSSTTLNTSPSTSAIRLYNNSGGNRTVRLTIDFGSYTGTFDGGVNAVGAVGFAMTNLDSITGTTVEFYDNSDSIVSTQTVGSTIDNVFFGYDNSAGTGISKIRISGSFPGGQNFIGFDDLGFTVVPEPSAFALGFGFLAGGFTFARRRRS